MKFMGIEIKANDYLRPWSFVLRGKKHFIAVEGNHYVKGYVSKGGVVHIKESGELTRNKEVI